MSLRCIPPIHPGEILRDDFMGPLGLTAGRVARALGVPRTRIERVVREEVGITPDTAVRLGRYFGTGAELWVNLQKSYELDLIAADGELRAKADAIVPFPRPDLEGTADEAA